MELFKNQKKMVATSNYYYAYLSGHSNYLWAEHISLTFYLRAFLKLLSVQ
jgi:hypothetical protein